jgi:hypothetical protein
MTPRAATRWTVVLCFAGLLAAASAVAAFNIRVEPPFTILDRGAGQPEVQIFVGFDTQFVNK